ncbi:hypothetical protein AgCh_028272 [Apium graveolens]
MDSIMMHINAKNLGEFSGSRDFLKQVELKDVRLEPNSIHGHAQQTNLEYLLLLDVERLVWSFRKTAGLSTLGVAYGVWEAPDCELHGHIIAYLLSFCDQEIESGKGIRRIRIEDNRLGKDKGQLLLTTASQRDGLPDREDGDILLKKPPTGSSP